jgi:hypothetical protein
MQNYKSVKVELKLHIIIISENHKSLDTLQPIEA